MNGVETVASWLTPPVLFCVLNVMIGAIFLRSKLYPPPPRNDRHLLVRVPSFLERVRSFNRSAYLPPQPEPAAREAEQPPQPDEAARETHHAPDPVANAAARGEDTPNAAARGTDAPSHVVVRTRSEAVVRAAPAARPPLQKSASERISVLREEEEERWRPATVRERAAGDEEVDEKADEFINNFRQQLKLQRMDSILRAGGGR
ncbi:pathogen-associated molecular patterns-induced protein A70-like [Salvia hispanica]|uniref:pathogen-associated molecular patterns-induced protein A70-like n=1 Tax=Salvia hispanica TaxID=49212 RepID=UPI002009A994|nr:pathogen-associated molecular patterns-induced protein A70-like [Salvia hispanica]